MVPSGPQVWLRVFRPWGVSPRDHWYRCSSPEPRSIVYDCRIPSTDRNNDTIHSAGDWGAPDSSQGGSCEDRGPLMIDTSTSRPPGPSIRSKAYFTNCTSSNGRGVSSLYTYIISSTNPTLLQSSPTNFHHFDFIFNTMYFLFSVFVYCILYFSKGHLPCNICTHILIIVDFIFTAFYFYFSILI